MTAIIYDIETAPLPLERVLAIEGEFDPSQYPPPGEFDPASVKVGNLGAEKAAAKIEAKREEHELAVQEHAKLLAAKQAEYETGLMNSAALSAATGQCLAIGLMLHDGRRLVLDNDSGEATLISRFWDMVQQSQGQRPGRDVFIGHCTHTFDLPFLVRRSRILGVDYPSWILKDHRYWHPIFADTAAVWSCGVWGERITLNKLSKCHGGPPKNGNGADFADLWASDRQAAIDYLFRDLECTFHAAKSMGMFHGYIEADTAAGNGRVNAPAAVSVAPVDRSPDLERACSLIESIFSMANDVPEAGESFASDASDFASSVSDYIDKRDSVTKKQLAALENFHDGLSRWMRE